ncbi:MAG: MFS transporter [Anaerolineales bacterium]|nr:MFS transporter [Anaerolineales bacterium]
MQESTTKRPTGMIGFTIIWIGQIVSVLASSMSQFGLTIWVFEKTQSATVMGLMQVFFITPFLLISPFAGVMVDRHNRKLMMMVSDLAAGLGTIFVLIFNSLGMLEVWHLYAVSVIFGLGMSFQWPAYSAAISTMVPKEQYGRANGMMSLIEAGPGVIAPLLAGALLPLIGLTGLLLLDVVTFTFAVGTLLFVHIPQPPRTEEGAQGRGNMLQEAAFGFKYIFARPSLLGLQMIFFAGNLFTGMLFTLLAPMVLSRTDNNSLIFGTVQTAGAIAGVVGGVVMSAWGGFKRRVHGVLLGWMVTGIGSAILGFTGGLPVWIVGVAIASVISPLVNSSNQAIWQAKVAPDVQGRVFSARRLIAWLTNPISPIIAGTLADYVVEPQMRVTSSGLSQTFGWLTGTGPGAGMGLIIIFCGLITIFIGLAGYFIPAVHNVEAVLPDHDELKKAEPEAAPA